jgi:hypothetical protein
MKEMNSLIIYVTIIFSRILHQGFRFLNHVYNYNVPLLHVTIRADVPRTTNRFTGTLQIFLPALTY